MRSYVGKWSFVAGVVRATRPVIAAMWAALAAADRQERISPKSGGRVWTRQIKHALSWLGAFLAEERGLALVRKFSFVPATSEASLGFRCDASPWGLGVVLIKYALADLRQ